MAARPLAATIVVVLWLASVPHCVQAYSTGAPLEACETLTQLHPQTFPQTSEMPYVLNIEEFSNGAGGYEYTPSSHYSLTLEHPQGVLFKGFLIQARRMADDTKVGEFIIGQSFTSNCDPPESSITHSESSDKPLVAVLWIAPPPGTGPLAFAYAVTQSFDVYWPGADVRTPVIAEAGDCGPPPHVDGATVSYDTTTLGAVANYTCEPGAVLVGPMFLVCLDAGFWSEPTPHCLVITAECPVEDADRCEQICVNAVGSIFCECYPGYELSPNGFNCSDINECDIGDVTCEKICTNTEGSYECDCYPGYELNEDGTTCRVLCSSEEVMCYGENICIPGRFRCDGIFDCLSGNDEASCQPDLEACSTDDIRLAEGATPSEGRIELCIDDYWSSICSEGWDVEGASVVCKQLDLSTVGVPASARDLTHDLTSIPIYETEFQCNGDESTIFDCQSTRGEGCNHFNDAGVRCLASDNCTHGAVRLLTVGDSDTVGRVEVCYKGVWAGVCDNDWRFTEASVVCQELNYNPIGALPLRYAFEQAGRDLFVFLSCNLDTGSLLQCDLLPTESCSTFEVGVRCGAYPPNGCEDGEVRLTHRDSPNFGQVQVCVNSTWGTVCQSSWDSNEAAVVCRQLGYMAPGHQAFASPVVAPGSGPIHLLDLNCNGSENGLLDCLVDGDNGQQFCDHRGDVSVRCSANPMVVLRPEGSVEVEVNREFKAQCKVDPFTFPNVTSLTAVKDEAPVESERGGVYITFANYPVDGGMGVLPEAEGFYVCVAVNPAGLDFASFSLSVLVPDPSIEGSSTIMRMSIPILERLLILFGQAQQFLTTEGLLDLIASRVFNDIPADFPGLQTVTCDYVGRQEVDIEHMLQRVECNIVNRPPIEDQLILTSQVLSVNLRNPDGVSLFNLFKFSANGFCDEDSVSTSYGTYSWPETERSTLGILPCTFGERVEGANALRQCNENGTWGEPVFEGCVMVTVNCSSEEFLCPFDDKCLPLSAACDGIEDCSSGLDEQVCQLECEPGEFLCSSNDRCIPSSQVCDVIPQCSDASDEAGCFEVCGSLEYYCRFEERCIPHNYVCDGYLDCLAAFDEYFCPVTPSNCTDGEMRLQDGRGEGEGRVEVCIGGVFLDVCITGWDVLEASVVCRELQLGSVGLPTTAIPRIVPAGLSDLQCTGNERSLLMCEGGSGDACDLDFEVAGVRCQEAECVHGDIRLVDGANEREGHVEICIEGAWGLVSDQQWVYKDAAVVCRQLGYEPIGALPLPNTPFVISDSPVFTYSINCIGNENSTFDCFTMDQLLGIPVDRGSDNVVYRYIAGVRCDDYNITYCKVEGNLRLTHRESERNGQVQSCINNTWTCISQGVEICNELGFLANGSAAVGVGLCTQVNCSSLPVIRLFPPPTSPEVSYSVEVGREFRLLCTVELTYFHGVHSVVTHKMGEEPDDLFLNATTSVYVLDISDNVGIAPEDAGTYRCVAANPAGTSELVITVEVEEPDFAGSSSSILFRVSFPKLDRIGMVFEDDSGFDGTGESLLKLLSGLFLNSIDEALPGVPVVDCYYVGRLRIGVQRGYDRAECNITNYPETDMTTIADMVLFELLTSPNFFFFPRISELGFCDDEFASGFHWSETEVGEVAVEPCPFGPAGSNATRQCGANGLWGAPNTDRCNRSVCQDGEVRLVDGYSESEGRVEFCQGNQWGTVCDRYWDYRDAVVVCRSLNYTFAKPVKDSFFGMGSGPVFLDGVQCFGNETSLEECPSDDQNYCGEVAGVVCSDLGDNCTDGDVRLVGSQLPSRGRVEICIGGVYGTVCDDSWDIADATVVCRQLGFHMALSAPQDAYFGEGFGAIYLDEVECSGNESYLLKCPHYGLHNHDCDHDEDASVECAVACSSNEFLCQSEQNSCRPDEYLCDGINDCLAAFDELNCTAREDNCTEGDTRLVGQLSDYQGLVEVCVDGIYWRLTMSEGQDTSFSVANVVCRQLGISEVGVPFLSELPSDEELESYGYYISGCTGSEGHILDCDIHLEGYGYNFGVRCKEPENCSDGDIRLVGGSHDLEGRVEMCYNEVWGAVGDEYDYWGYDEASVVCNQLGYNRLRSLAISGTYFGEISDAIVCYVDCDGSEEELLDCSIGLGACVGVNSVGVVCEDFEDDCSEGEVRLVGRNSFSQGTVQVCASGHWETLCTGGWSAAATNVACRALGFPDYDHQQLVITDLEYGVDPGNDDIVVACNGTEVNISECDIIYSGDSEGVECSGAVGVCCADYPRIHLEPLLSPYEYVLEVGRELSLVCREDDGNFPSDITISVFKGSNLLAHGSYGVEIFDGERLSPEDQGTYSCMAENAIGNTTLEFFVRVLAPAASENGSSVFARFSVPEFTRAVLIYDVPAYTGFEDSRELRRSLREDDYEFDEDSSASDDQEDRISAEQLTPELFIQMISNLILDVFPEEMLGIQTVNCSYVGNQAIDTERRLQRVECNITNYPHMEGFREVVERAVLVIKDVAELRTEFGVTLSTANGGELRREFQLFRVSVNAFCDAEYDELFQWPETEGGDTVSVLCPESGEGQVQGLANRTCGLDGEWSDPQLEECVPICLPETLDLYNWPGTMEGMTASLPCLFGPEGATATRACGLGGQWEEPQQDQCTDPTPTDLFVLDPEPPDGGLVYTFTVGSEMQLACRTFDFSGTVAWERSDGRNSTLIADGGEYAVLQAELLQRGIRPKDAGRYRCVPSDASFENVSIEVEIDVREKTEDFSFVVVRLSAPRFIPNPRIIDDDDTEVEGAILLQLEQLIRNIATDLPYNGFIFPECVYVTNRMEDDLNNWLRVECTIFESPSSTTTQEFGEDVITSEAFRGSLYIASPDSTISLAASGFCDETFTSSIIDGDYMWPESAAGSEASHPCRFGPGNQTAKRLCSASTQPTWQDPDFSLCTNRRPTITFIPSDSIVEEGRRVMLTCESTGPFAGKVSWSNHSKVTAQQPMVAIFDVLDPVGSATGEVTPTASGGGDERYFFEGSTSGEGPFTVGAPPPDILYTIRDSDYRVTLVTHPFYGVVADLEDEYTCVAKNEFADNAETILLDVKERREAGSITGAVRVTLDGQLDEDRPEQVGYYLLYIEAMLLDYIDLGGQQEAIKCDEVESCPEERRSRIECVLYGSRVEDVILISNLLADGLVDVPIIPQSNRTGERRFCDCEETETAHGRYRWNETLGGTDMTLECDLGPAEGFSEEEARAMRRCGEDGEWEEERLSQCITQVTLDLQALAQENITADNFEEVAEDLTETITMSGEEDQTEDNVAIVADVFASTAALLSDQEDIVIQESTVEGYVDVIDTIDDWDPEAVRQMGSEVIEAFETISAGLFRDDNFTMVEFEGVSVTFTAERIDVDVQTSGSRFTTAMTENGTLDSNTTEGQGDSLPPDQIASAFLPPTLFDEIEGSGDVNVVFTLFNSPTLFPVSEDAPEDIVVGTPVVGAAVAGQSFVDLPEPVIILLRLKEQNITAVTCVSWSFELNAWISEGCVTMVVTQNDSKVAECSCNHLTNFAALVDICRRDENCDERRDDDSEEELALEVITYVGVGLSLIGIVATIVTLLAFKRLRKRDATKLHVQLCVAIGLMLIMFAVGVDRSEVKGVCVAMSALIQYFTLVSVMWMGAEALLMFQKLVIVFVEITVRYHIIVSLVCWLSPLVPVIIPLAIDRDYLLTFDSNDDIDFCFIGEVGVFWGAFLGPIFAILLFNLVIFVAVVIVLVKHSRNSLGRVKGPQKQKTTIRLLISIAGIMSLFGLSWLFAALTVREASIAFQFLFTIFNAFQGFFIFLFFCVFSKDARELWKEVLTCGRYQSSFNTSKPYVSSGQPKRKPAATTSTALAGSGPSTLRSDLTLSDTHASSGDGRYDIHIMTSFQSEQPSTYEHHSPDLPTVRESFQVIPADSGNVFANPTRALARAETYNVHLKLAASFESEPSEQPSPFGQYSPALPTENIFTNPSVPEPTESLGLVEETERELNFRHSQVVSGFQEMESVEVHFDTGGRVEGGGGVGVGVEVDPDEGGEAYSGRIRGVVV